MRTSSSTPLARAMQRAVEFLFPPQCQICLTPMYFPTRSNLCKRCEQEVERIFAPYCSRCGRPFAAGAGRLCMQCIDDPPPYRYLRAPYAYAGPLRESILNFKMKSRVNYAPSMAALLLETERMGIDWEFYDLILPVPLHDNRIKWRGYNHCALMVSQAAKKRKIQWTDEAIIRSRDTTPQFQVAKKHRRKNVAGAFYCPDKKFIERKSILLVDDIVTTGSTIYECAKVLRKAGASVVDAVALTRAV